MSCAQFDWIAEQVGVGFASPKHYRISSRLAKRAGSGRKMESIDFDRKWLFSLNEQARCSMIVHEFWHWIIWKRTMRERKRFLVYLFLWLPLLSVAIVGGLELSASVLLGTQFHPAVLVLSVVLWPILLYGFMGRLMKRFFWPTEYECDEAAVRYIGAPATLDVLKTFHLTITNATHPPTKLRIARVNELAAKYPTPLIDFARLQAEIPQSFDPIVPGRASNDKPFG